MSINLCVISDEELFHVEGSATLPDRYGGVRRPDPDRRTDPRKSVALAGLVVAPGVEQSCRIVDVSSSGCRIRLDRPTGVPPQLVLIDVTAGEAIESQIVWIKDGEIGLKAVSRASLSGLTPSRFAAARAAWLRVTGRS